MSPTCSTPSRTLHVAPVRRGDRWSRAARPTERMQHGRTPGVEKKKKTLSTHPSWGPLARAGRVHARRCPLPSGGPHRSLGPLQVINKPAETRATAPHPDPHSPGCSGRIPPAPCAAGEPPLHTSPPPAHAPLSQGRGTGGNTPNSGVREQHGAGARGVDAGIRVGLDTVSPTVPVGEPPPLRSKDEHTATPASWPRLAWRRLGGRRARGQRNKREAAGVRGGTRGSRGAPSTCLQAKPRPPPRTPPPPADGGGGCARDSGGTAPETCARPNGAEANTGPPPQAPVPTRDTFASGPLPLNRRCPEGCASGGSSAVEGPRPRAICVPGHTRGANSVETPNP